MQQRRFRPGDVLDDYCPRERRITDHAIVAMIDDDIKQTRCVVCDAEHEYKEGKIPPQRRKRAQSGLFTQVLDGLQGPQPAARLAQHSESDSVHELAAEVPTVVSESPDALMQTPVSGNGGPPTVDDEAVPDRVAAAPDATPAQTPDQVESMGTRDEGPIRRQLIRAALPRPQGTPAPGRNIPEFTIRQSMNTRGRGAGRRRDGHEQRHGMNGPMRFGQGGRDQGHGQPGAGRGQGPTKRGRRGGSRRSKRRR